MAVSWLAEAGATSGGAGRLFAEASASWAAEAQLRLAVSGFGGRQTVSEAAVGSALIGSAACVARNTTNRSEARK